MSSHGALISPCNSNYPDRLFTSSVCMTVFNSGQSSVEAIALQSLSVWLAVCLAYSTKITDSRRQTRCSVCEMDCCDIFFFLWVALLLKKNKISATSHPVPTHNSNWICKFAGWHLIWGLIVWQRSTSRQWRVTPLLSVMAYCNSACGITNPEFPLKQVL